MGDLHQFSSVDFDDKMLTTLDGAYSYVTLYRDRGCVGADALRTVLAKVTNLSTW